MADKFKITVKYWSKKIGTEDFERFLNLIKETAPLTEKEWDYKTVSIRKGINKYGQFVHLETDIEDSSEGIMPKQMKILGKFKDSELIELFSILNRYVTKEPLSTYIDNDGFLSWQNLFSHFLYELYSENFIEFKNNIILRFLERKIFAGLYLEDIELSLDAIDKIRLLKENNILPEKITSLDDLDIDSIIEKRKLLWKNIVGFAPQSKWILLANPNNFSKEFIVKVQDVFETKQLGKLPEEIQKYIGTLLNLIGKNIIVLTNQEIINGMTMTYKKDDNFTVGAFVTLLKKVKKSDNFTVNRLIHYVQIFTENQDLVEEFKKKDEVTEKDLNVFQYRVQKINSASKNRREQLKNIPFRFWASFYRFNVTKVREIEELVELYENNKNNKCNIPVVSGSMGKYTYEILEKKDPTGLILGYSTDCCQVLTRDDDDGELLYDGAQCLVSGYTEEKATFFVVKKGNDVYAQSFVWEKTTKEGKILCFDSIEVLGKDLTKNKDVIKSYQEASTKLLELGYDIIIAGADGHIIPKGLKEIGTYLSPVPEELKLDLDIYSDARDEIIILGNKDFKLSSDEENENYQVPNYDEVFDNEEEDDENNVIDFFNDEDSENKGDE